MKEVFIFDENQNHDLRSGTHVVTRNMHTEHFGTDTITNLGSKFWKRLPEEIKNAQQLSALKYRIKIWTTDRYRNRFCKMFVKNLEVCPNI